MAYKGRVTLEAIFSSLSQQIEDARSAQNDKRLEELEKVVSILSDIAAQCGDELIWQEGKSLTSQGRMTLADLLCSLCEQIMALENVPNAMHASKLCEIVHFLNELAVQCKDTLLYYAWLDDMIYSLNYAFLVPFKMGVPSEREIRETLAAADQYQGVQATLIRRQWLRSPKAHRAYLWDDDDETVLEPEWVGIARASGPYMETIDSLLYKYDGTLLSFDAWPLVAYPFYDARNTLDANRVLEEVLVWAEQRYGADPKDWELCRNAITDEAGRLPWLPAQKEE